MLEPPRGCVALSKIKTFYHIIRNNGSKLSGSEEEHIVGLQWDLVESLSNLSKWLIMIDNKYADDDYRSNKAIDNFCQQLIKAKDPIDAVVIIDTIINAYHELGPFLNYIFREPWDQVQEYLDNRRDS